MFGIYIKKPEPLYFTDRELAMIRLGNDPDEFDKIVTNTLNN